MSFLKNIIASTSCLLVSPTPIIFAATNNSNVGWVPVTAKAQTAWGVQAISGNFGFRDKEKICENQNQFVDHEKQMYTQSFSHSFYFSPSFNVPLSLEFTTDVIKDMCDNNSVYSISNTKATSKDSKIIKRKTWNATEIASLKNSMSCTVYKSTGSYCGSQSVTSSVSCSDSSISYNYELSQNDTSTWSPFGYDAETMYDHYNPWIASFNVKFNFESLKLTGKKNSQGDITITTSTSSTTPFMSVSYSSSKAKGFWSGEVGGDHWAGAWHKATWGGLGALYASFNWSNLNTSATLSTSYSNYGDVSPQSGWNNAQGPYGITPESNGWICDKHWWYQKNPSYSNKANSYSISQYTYSFSTHNPLIE